MFGRLRECADGADLEGHLRGPDQGKLWQGARRFRVRQSDEAGTADRPSVLGAGGRADNAEGNHMKRDGTRPEQGPERVSAMKNCPYIGMHAAAAAAIMYLLSGYALRPPLE